MFLLVFCKSSTRSLSVKTSPFIPSPSLLGHPLAAFAKQHDVHTEAGRNFMELITGVVDITGPASAFLGMLHMNVTNH